MLLTIVVFLLSMHVSYGATVWSEWSEWSACGLYDLARHTRVRKCLDSRDGRELKLSQCFGLPKRTRQCQSCSFALSRHVNLSSLGTDAMPINKTWCIEAGSRINYVQISFRNFVQLTAVSIKGQHNSHVSVYKLSYSYDGKTWFSYINDALLGNVKNVAKIAFKPRLVTRYIRLYLKRTTARTCFQAQVFGCTYNCGGLIKHDVAVIQSPIASEQTEELNCLWKIDSVHASKLHVKFSHFKLPCNNGILDIYNGVQPYNSDNIDNLLEGYCGHGVKIPPNVFQGRSLWMHYHTNSTSSDIDFSIQLNSIVIKTLNATSGTIKLPSNTDYSNIYRYSWIITAPKDNDIIQLTLDYFHTNNTRIAAAKCVADAIIIHYSNEKGRLVEKYCHNKPQEFNSNTGFMKIKYKSRLVHPKWRIKFSYKIVGYRETPLIVPTRSRDKNESLVEASTIETEVNDTDTEATQKNNTKASASKLPIIVSAVVAVLFAVVCLVALFHYMRRRRKFLKHPYDCSNRPMSHFGEQDGTPFINSNLLMWNDAEKKSRNNDKIKKYLPVVEVTLRENEPLRLSVIPPEVLKSNSEISTGIPSEEDTLKVSDNFTEECMKLLNNNLAINGNNHESNPDEMILPVNMERYGSLPEADRRSRDGNDSLPEAETPNTKTPETDALTY